MMMMKKLKEVMKNMNRIKQQAENSINIYLYGEIADYWWDDESNSAKCLKDKLTEMNDITEINLHINSLGGDVIEGIAMFNLLKQHPAKVNVYVDGFACSIASVIAMAGDTIYMPKNSMMMIHIMEASIESYLRKINISREELIELLDAETYLTAEECYKMGFADVLMPISETIEQSATKSILQLVEENKKLKEQKNTNKDSKNENNFDKICEMLENKYELKIKECSEERPKQNVFESFFNAILKEEK